MKQEVSHLSWAMYTNSVLDNGRDTSLNFEKLIHYTRYGGRGFLLQLRIVTEGVCRDAGQFVALQIKIPVDTGHGVSESYVLHV